MLCVGLLFCLNAVPLHLVLPLRSLLSSSLHPRFCLGVVSQGSSEGSNIFASVPRLISFPNGRHGSMAGDRNGSCGTGGIGEWEEGFDRARDRHREREML